MEKLGLNEIRKKFLDFFESKNHYVRSSYSLIPQNDKSLLLINAGMAPLKPYFMGVETPPNKRMATCQKCIRTGDIENVGHTARHATFFEMLGNFSFGDYFKREAIQWAWEFSTEYLQLAKDKLWVTIYENDDEAHEIWQREIGVPENRIVRLGKEDNFWEIGIGPCGPCSELYYDRGEKYGCHNEKCQPGCDCDRYVEFWNLVFTQFNKDEEGNYNPLPNPNIDTGMGLERIACIMQGVETIFEVDTLSYILNSVSQLAKIDYKSSNSPQDISVRVITDHIRSVTFMVCDGIMPSNEGRGYVLRRLLRRASRHGKLLGIDGLFLTGLVDKVIEISKDAYPELSEREDYIKKIILIEEERFQETIDQGTHRLNEYIDELISSDHTVLSGEYAFRLYDTYGFPLELTEEILSEKGYTVNRDEFDDHMENQKNMARSARKSNNDVSWEEGFNVNLENYSPTIFTGYHSYEEEASVLALIKGSEEVKSASQDEMIKVILDKTPFYAESGGQQGDKGTFENKECKLEVIHCEKMRGFYIHHCVVKEGTLAQNDKVIAKIDKVGRNASAKNHTATHLLHKTLNDVLGSHVEQAGSFVSPERLRFDFTHFENISKEDLNKIEEIINEKIAENLNVITEEMNLKDAIAKGATALFGEKYDGLVRVVCAGDYSMELCGGTHVSGTGLIGAFKIISENGIAAGIRRIEAITGKAIYNLLIQKETIIESACHILKTNENNLLDKIEILLMDNKSMKKEIENQRKESMQGSVDDMLSKAKEMKDMKLVSSIFDNMDPKSMRELGDKIKEKAEKVVAILTSKNEDKLSFLVFVTDDILDRGIHAGNIVKKISEITGGKGGGKADMAQGGGKDASKMDEALQAIEEILTQI
ncbi:MAG: alanine--tRNA ligase [Peptostreptococcales bacterium]